MMIMININFTCASICTSNEKKANFSLKNQWINKSLTSPLSSSSSAASSTSPIIIITIIIFWSTAMSSTLLPYRVDYLEQMLQEYDPIFQCISAVNRQGLKSILVMSRRELWWIHDLPLEIMMMIMIIMMESRMMMGGDDSMMIMIYAVDDDSDDICC